MFAIRSTHAPHIVAASALIAGCGTTASTAEVVPDADADTSIDTSAEATDTAGDAARDVGADPPLDATSSIGEITLTCDFEFRDTLDLATGEVRTIASDSDDVGDLTCSLGRFIGLVGPDSICPVGSSASELDMVALPAQCEDADAEAWTTNLLCGVNVNGPFQPACLNSALIVRDIDSGAFYRVLLLEDFIDDERGSGVRLVYGLLTD